MRSEITFLTHAEAEQAREERFASDTALTPRGRAAAAQFAAVFGMGAESFVSPALAARETARILALTATPDDRLADLDLGTWNGRDIAEIAAAHPEAAAAFIGDPHFAGHGGESIARLIARVGSVLDAVREAPGRRLAIAHGAVLRAALISALDAPPASFWKVDAAPLTRLRLTSDGRRWSLRALGPLSEATGSPASPTSD